MKTTLGGDRLGSGNKQEISLRNYERSTHDLSYVHRTTASAGTLIPFMNELALSGDTFKIDLETLVKTNPTIAPLFGSFKIQLDVFLCPIRLYQGALQMNKINVGLDMGKVKLPQMILRSRVLNIIDNSHEQINSSSIFSYLDIRGLGNVSNGLSTTEARRFSALKWLFYWEIYKNYYANKQEEVGAVIHTPPLGSLSEVETMTLYRSDLQSFSAEINPLQNPAVPVDVTLGPTTYMVLTGTFDEDFDPSMVKITLENEVQGIPQTEVTLSDIFATWTINPAGTVCTLSSPMYVMYPAMAQNPPVLAWNTWIGWRLYTQDLQVPPKVKLFPLESIEFMREKILSNYEDSYTLDTEVEEPEYPYSYALAYDEIALDNTYASMMRSQEGLALKTYQSDLFNNWISTEWIDGENGINEITAIDTSSGSFTLDTFNLQRKIYEMLNRVAISGGTYNDYLEATYDHKSSRLINSPMYLGGLSRELVFEEITSNSSTDGQPLGSLAGKGRMSEKKKGGHIEITVDEPSIITGIFSLTPRLDYSQGNKWDNELQTFNDFHKPVLDEIGFQDLVTDQMAFFDTNIDPASYRPIYKSAGKQPAWINYMTNVNRTYGNFASGYSQSYMVMNRDYEREIDTSTPIYTYGIKDLTTYIDPQKWNHIFAQVSRDAQNFWVQIAVDIEARRKMSAKVIPNL